MERFIFVKIDPDRYYTFRDLNIKLNLTSIYKLGGYIAGSWPAFLTGITGDWDYGYPSDVDIFCKNKASFVNIKKYLTGLSNVKVDKVSRFAVSYDLRDNNLIEDFNINRPPLKQYGMHYAYNSTMIQVIASNIGNPFKVVSTFDFSVSKAILDLSTMQILVGENFIEDSRNGRLRIEDARWEGNLINLFNRISKYEDKGYGLLAEDTVRMLNRFKLYLEKTEKKDLPKYQQLYNLILNVLKCFNNGNVTNRLSDLFNLKNVVKTSYTELIEELNKKFS